MTRRSLWEFTQFIWWMQNSAKRLSTIRPSHLTWAVSPPVGIYRLQPPSPFIIITQPESWYSFTIPRTVEGWADLGTIGRVHTASAQGCKSQWFLRSTQLPTARFNPRTLCTAVKHATSRPLQLIVSNLQQILWHQIQCIVWKDILHTYISNDRQMQPPTIYILHSGQVTSSSQVQMYGRTIERCIFGQLLKVGKIIVSDAEVRFATNQAIY